MLLKMDRHTYRIDNISNIDKFQFLTQAMINIRINLKK